jgi:hypothetical protein
MSMANATETDILNLVFNATALPWNANTDLFLALHTADPTETGSYAAEATYTSYARVAVDRDSGGWTVSGAVASNTALVQFPQCTGGSNTITHISIGTASSGGQMIASGALNTPLTVTNLITPQFSASSLQLQLD